MEDEVEDHDVEGKEDDDAENDTVEEKDSDRVEGEGDDVKHCHVEEENGSQSLGRPFVPACLSTCTWGSHKKHSVLKIKGQMPRPRLRPEL